MLKFNLHRSLYEPSHLTQVTIGCCNYISPVIIIIYFNLHMSTIFYICYLFFCAYCTIFRTSVLLFSKLSKILVLFSWYICIFFSRSFVVSFSYFFQYSQKPWFYKAKAAFLPFLFLQWHQSGYFPLPFQAFSHRTPPFQTGLKKPVLFLLHKINYRPP